MQKNIKEYILTLFIRGMLKLAMILLILAMLSVFIIALKSMQKLTKNYLKFRTHSNFLKDYQRHKILFSTNLPTFWKHIVLYFIFFRQFLFVALTCQKWNLKLFNVAWIAFTEHIHMTLRYRKFFLHLSFHRYL